MLAQWVTVRQQEALVDRFTYFTGLAVKSVVGCHLGFSCNVRTDGHVVPEAPFWCGLVTNWVNDRKIERLIIRRGDVCGVSPLRASWCHRKLVNAFSTSVKYFLMEKQENAESCTLDRTSCLLPLENCKESVKTHRPHR